MVIKNLISLSFASTGFFALITGVANAVTFSLTTGNGQPTITQTVDGLTATFSNASFEGDSRNFVTDSDGLAVLDGPAALGNDLGRFELSFNQDVQLISYLPGFVSGLEGDESLTLSSGGASSVETGFQDEVLTNFSNQFIIPSGQTIVFESNFGSLNDSSGSANSFDLLQFRELTVNIASASVPECSPTLGLLAVGGLFGISRLRKSTKSNKLSQ